MKYTFKGNAYNDLGHFNLGLLLYDDLDQLCKTSGNFLRVEEGTPPPNSAIKLQKESYYTPSLKKI